MVGVRSTSAHLSKGRRRVADRPATLSVVYRVWRNGSRETPLAPIYVTQDGGYGGPWASVRIVFPFDSTSCFLQTSAADTCFWFCPIATQIGKIIKRDVLYCVLGPDLASTSLIGKPRAQRLAVCLFERAG